MAWWDDVVKKNQENGGLPDIPTPMDTEGVEDTTQTTYTATWGCPTHTSIPRTITAVLTLSEDPGSAFDVTQDFFMEGIHNLGDAGIRDTGWTFSSTGSGTTRTIKATNDGTSVRTHFRIGLRSAAFGSGKPSDDIYTAWVSIPFTAEWACPTYTSSPRAITAVINFSQNPPVTHLTTGNYRLERRTGSVGSYTWTETHEGSISYTGSRSSFTVTALIGDRNPAGTYRIVLEMNTFSNNRPASDVATDIVSVGAGPSVYFLNFYHPHGDTTSRVLYCTMEFSPSYGDPGAAALNIHDFHVERRSGVQGSYTWTDTTEDWNILVPSSGRFRQLTITPHLAVPAGTYRVVLEEDAVANNVPPSDIASNELEITDPPDYQPVWGLPTYNPSTNSISATLTLPEDPGASFSTAPFDQGGDFITQHQGTIGDLSEWVGNTFSITSTGTGRNRTITSVGPRVPETNVRAIYRILLRRNAFGTGKPATDHGTLGISLSKTGSFVVTLGAPSYDSSTRAFSSVITLSEDPGAAFSVCDFHVEIRSGTTGDYTWCDTTGWTLSTSGSGTSRTITATPSNTVVAGTYRLVLNQNAFGTNKPGTVVTSSEAFVGAYVYRATWGCPSSPQSNRAFSSVITLSEDPGAAFSVCDDFHMETFGAGGTVWQSKGVVTFPLVSQYMNPFQGATGSPNNVLYGWRHNSNARYAFSIGSFSGGAATATRTGRTSWHNTIWGHTGAVDGRHLFTFATRPTTYDINVRTLPDGGGGWARNDICVSPVPSEINTVTSSTSTTAKVYALDSASSPTIIRAYTLNISTETVTTNASDNITLVSGAGTVALDAAALLSDGTYIWVAGINSSNAQQAQGWCYQLSDGARVISRDFEYTDTEYLSHMTMLTSGDIYIFRRHARDANEAESISNTARVLEFTSTASTWNNTTGWNLSACGTGAVRTITGTPASSVPTGTYRFVLNEDAFGTDKPPDDIASSGQTISSYVYSATWGSVSYTASTRAISAVITLGEDPGATFSICDDFHVEVRTGSVGSYNWCDATGWNLASTGSGTSRTITATPTNSVAAGTYRLVLDENAFGNDKPAADTASAGRAVAALTIAPTWSGDFDNAVRAGSALSWNLSSLVSGSPTPTLEFRSGYTKPTWLSLSGTTLSGTPPRNDYPSDTSITIQMNARNSGGSACQDLTLWITRNTPAQPSGSVSNKTGTVGVATSIDMSSEVTGVPSPTFTILNNSLSGTGLTLSGSTLSGTPCPSHAGAHTIEWRAENVLGSVCGSFTYTVSTSAPTGTIPAQTATAGTAFSLNLASHITGTPNPTFAVSGLSGTGLSFSGTTISGTPARSNARTSAYQITVTASNASETICRTFNLNIRSAAQWSSIPNQTATENVAFSLDLSTYVSGVPAPTISERNNSFPAWLSLSGTTISGTPSAPAAATTIQVSATNAVGTTVHQSFTLTVNATGVAPSWSGDFDDAVRAGSALSWNLASLVSGNPSPTIEFRSGYTKPTWLSLSGTTLSGTPPRADYPSDTSITIQMNARNSVGSACQNLTLWITRNTPAAPSGSIANQSGTPGVAFNLNLASHITGVPNPTFAVTGLSGTGLNHSGTTLSGTPALGHVGTHPISVTATNAKGALTRSFNFVVTSSIPTGTIPNQTAHVGSAFSLNLLTLISGTPTPTFTETGLSAAGLSLSGTTISGTPSASNIGSHEVTVTAENESGSICRTFTIDVSVALTAPTGTIPAQTATAGATFCLDLSAHITGNPNPTFAVTGLSGTGLSVCGGIINGTPLRVNARAAAYAISVTATNSEDSLTRTFNLSIRAVPQWSVIANRTIRVNEAFSLDIAGNVEGFPTPTITERNSSFPSWLSLSGTTLSGTPTATACPEAIQLTATNAVGTAHTEFTIQVEAVPEPVVAGARGHIIPLAANANTADEDVAAWRLEFDTDVELSDGSSLVDRIPEWLDIYGLPLPDSAITVFERDVRVIRSLNPPCTTRRFATNATFTLGVEIQPKVDAAPTVSDFNATNVTITSITTLGVGRLYELNLTFPASGTGTSTLSALAASFDGVDADVELMTCLFGGANLRVANFPTGVVPESTSVVFDVICEPKLTSAPNTNSITVSAGSVTSICPVRENETYRVTLSVPAGTGTVTVTAVASGWTNLSANQRLGSFQYRAV